ncbi:MAG: hypothetical protein J6O40_00960 [Ruminococcus sp.]|nr:hypothetical protein [Ruminococcus sp.]
MKKEKFFEVLGEIDDEKIKAAENAPNNLSSNKKRLAIGLCAAACIGLVIGAGIWLGKSQDITADSTGEQSESNDDSEDVLALECADVDIYYVDGNEIKSVTEYLPLSAEEIFDRWKAHNNIGTEVRLIDVRLDDNGTDSADSFVAYHTAGDHFTLNITISKSIENYYDTLPEEDLLESLKLTMTGYSDIEIDEYNLVLE